MKVTGWGRRRRKRWSRRRRAFPNWFRPLRVGYVPDLVRPPGRNQPPLLKCTHTHVHKIGAGKKSYVATYRNSHVRKRPQIFRRGRIWEMRAHWAEQEWRRNLLWKGREGGGGGVGWARGPDHGQTRCCSRSSSITTTTQQQQHHLIRFLHHMSNEFFIWFQSMSWPNS